MPESKPSIVFMGTPEFAASALRAILDAGFRVSAVVTQPDRPKGRGQSLAKPPVKVLAEEEGIAILQPEKIRTPEFEAWLLTQAPKYVVVVAYGRILPKNILSLPPGGCINVHASLLPRWRGASPIQWAIVNGDTETGVTTMLMDEGLDTGPMLLMRKIPIGPNENAESLHDRLAILGGEAVCETLAQLEGGTLHPTPQPAAGATYAPLLKKENGAILWTEPAKRIHDLVRGLTPWPGAYGHIRGNYLKILSAEVTQGSGNPGEILRIEGSDIDVAVGEGAVRLHDVQPAGKRRMAAGDYFRGLHLQPGEKLITVHDDKTP